MLPALSETVPQTVIVDFGLGNMRSVQHKLTVGGVRADAATTPGEVVAASHLLLPGVGHFGPAMEALENSGLASAIKEAVLGRGVPILGICLGMQLLTDGSEESGTAGLSIVGGRTEHLSSVALGDLPVPNLGWSTVTWDPRISDAFEDASPSDCYFAHSYHVVCDEESVIGTMDYGRSLTAAVQSGPAVGVQFHPEKSHRAGMKRLIDLIRWQVSR